MLAPRRKLACSTCTHRKVKCDKQIPCNNCVRRGTPGDCERADRPETVSQPAKVVTPTSGGHSGQPSPLGDAVLDHETVPLSRKPSTSVTRTLLINEEQSEPSSNGLISSPARRPEIEDEATVLEFLAWGRMKDPHKAGLSPQAFKDHTHDEHEQDYDQLSNTNLDPFGDPVRTLLPWLQILLPSHRQITQLVEYHNTHLLWFHGSYIAALLTKQVSSFLGEHGGNLSSPGVDLQWVALLFAIMAGAITSAPVEQIKKWRFEVKEAKILAQKWHKSILASLNASEYTVNHSIYSVQAVATLTGTAHMLGHSNSQSAMLATAIRIAQTLGLHRLSGDTRGDELGIEQGRRAWLQLCTQDWFSTSFSETYAIHELHSTSLPPKHCNDDMLLVAESLPTITSFPRLLNRIASLMPRLQDAMALSNTLYTKYEQVLSFDKKMRALTSTERPAFLSDARIDDSWPVWVPWARKAVDMSLAHKTIMIHRKFLTLSFNNPIFEGTRQTCLLAAKTILREYITLSDDEESPSLWTHQAFSVAACIVICLDALYQDSMTDESESLLVTRTIESLQISGERSMIASRGVKLLKALRKQISEKQSSRKRPLDSEGRRSREVRAFNATSIILSFCFGEEPASSAPTGLVNGWNQASTSNSTEVQNPEYQQLLWDNDFLNSLVDLNGMQSLPFKPFDDSQDLENLFFGPNQISNF